MKLFYSPGACSLSPHIVLREAGRTFDLERVDLKTHRTASGADFYTINPKGYVPALQLDSAGNEILTEGPAIVQYIADLVPESRLAPPQGTFARYHLLEWLAFINGEIHKTFGALFIPDTPEIVRERSRGKIADRLQYVSADLVDKGFLMGETFSVADAYLYVMLRWCTRFDIDLQIWPNIDDYYQRVDARPSVQAALAAEGLLEKKRRAPFATGAAAHR